MVSKHLLPIVASYVCVSIYGVVQSLYLLSKFYQSRDELISDCVLDMNDSNDSESPPWDECQEMINEKLMLHTVLCILLFLTIACCDFILTKFVLDFRKNPQAYLSRGIWWKNEPQDVERGTLLRSPRPLTSCSVNAPPPVYTSMSNEEDDMDRVKSSDTTTNQIPLGKMTSISSKK